jgi:ACR3 family arsenite efflux pump ArsB
MVQTPAGVEASASKRQPAEGPASLSMLDRFQPLLLLGSIAAGLGLAEVAPGFAEGLSPVVSVAVLVLIYLVMLSVDVRQVASALANRRFLVTAVLLNFVVNPLAAWVLAEVFLSGHPELRVGLVLFLVTPCIGWYLVFTELADGDAGLGVSLLGINLVLQILLLPLFVAVFAGTSASVELRDLAGSVVIFLVVPALAAVATRWIVARTDMALDDVQDAIGDAHLKTLALVAVIVAMFASQSDVLLDNPRVVVTLVPPMAAFFGFTFVLALIVGRLTGLGYGETVALVFTTTSRNSEASLAIAATAFASPLVALTVVIGPVIELPLLVVMVRVLLGVRPWIESATPTLESSAAT